MSKRRTNTVGSPMLVKLPDDIWPGYGSTDEKEWDKMQDHKWYNTGEGGLAFFFIIPQKDFHNRRQVCIAGDLYFPAPDVAVTEAYRRLPNGDGLKGHEWQNRRLLIDGGLLIGSTGLSIAATDSEGNYFEPTYDDLTDAGKELYNMLEDMYGKDSIDIVTLLDT